MLHSKQLIPLQKWETLKTSSEFRQGGYRFMNPEHYSMVIQWDPRDDIYIVSVPELPGCRTHGKTYEEAIQNILEVIELWIDDDEKSGEPIPPPMVAT